MAKKIAIALFALVFVYSYLLYYAIACFQFSSIKHDVEKLRHQDQYKSGQLILFSFNKTEKGTIDATINWHSDEEFFYQGKLYDIIRKKETNDSIHFYCIKDDLENELLMELTKHVMCFTHDSSGEPNDSEFKFLLKDFICHDLPSAEKQVSIKPRITYTSYFFLYIPSSPLSISTPPPRHFLS
ncbi:MAG TPA: hypothetical protein VK750_04715 [Cytophagaceae bacterium]|nr:hypothetical protein [Cytophagaceae bacterium]